MTLVGDRQQRPASIHAEMTILGAVMVEPRAIEDAATLVRPEDFSLDSHRRIYASVLRLADAGHAVDLITVSEDLRKKKELEAIGGIPYLASLSEGLPRKLSIESYVRIVRDKSLMRELMEVCEAGMAEAGDQAEEAMDVLNRVAMRLAEINLKGTAIRPVSIAELVKPTLEEMMEQRNYEPGKVLGITSGIRELDAVNTGFRKGELTYVGALPGRGKTSFMLQAMHAGAMAGHKVGCISLEMRSTQLMRRLAILHSRIHAQKWRDVRTMSEYEFGMAKQSVLNLGELQIDICDQSGLNPTQLASLARQMHSNGAEEIFVDFVQIIHEDRKERREAINQASAALRDTCKALEIPFIVGSQLARRDANPNRRPTLQDLRESGNLEQDAHNVYMLYRPKDERGEWTYEDEIIIEKAREGATGPVLVKYDEQTLSYVGRQ